MEDLDQKLKRLTDVVAAIAQNQDQTAEIVARLSETQARTAENNAQAFASIQAALEAVVGAIAETRAIADSNARAIQAFADDRG